MAVCKKADILANHSGRRKANLKFPKFKMIITLLLFNHYKGWALGTHDKGWGGGKNAPPPPT